MSKIKYHCDECYGEYEEHELNMLVEVRGKMLCEDCLDDLYRYMSLSEKRQMFERGVF